MAFLPAPHQCVPDRTLLRPAAGPHRTPPARSTFLSHRSIRVIWVLLVGLAALLALPTTASAAPESRFSADTANLVVRTGVVVRIAQGEFVIDLGGSDGLQVGNPARMYRTIKVRHPVTGRDVIDRFLLGETDVLEVAPHMAIVRPDKPWTALLQLGDRVEVQVPRPGAKPGEAAEVPAPAAKAPVEAAPRCAPSQAKCPACPQASACAPCPTCPTCPPAAAGKGTCEELTPDMAAAYSAFFLCLGKQPAERVEIWRRFLQRFPDTSLREPIDREIAVLVHWMDQLRFAASDDSQRRKAEVLGRRVAHVAPTVVRQGELLWLVFSTREWDDVTDLRIHWRKAGDERYDLARPEASGPQHRRWQVPSAAVTPQGLEYFVVASPVGGNEAAVVGTPEHPAKIRIEPQLGEARVGPQPRSTLRLTAEHVDFNRYRGDDAVVEAHADMTYHLAEPVPLYSFTMGYGVYAGRGGSVAESDDLILGIRKDDTLDSKSAAFKFAYLGGEWMVAESFYLLTQVVVGLDRSGMNTGLDLAGRVGKDTGTNLLLGFSTLGDLGRAGQIVLTGRIDPRLAMAGHLEVTNRPVRSDLAVRLIYEVLWRASDLVELSARLGYNLRTINHAGMSAGGSLIFHW